MAEDKVEPREVNWRQLMPWTVLFQGFRVALDPNKLLLAAAGILLMAFGWWLLSVIFHYDKPKPDDPDYQNVKVEGDQNPKVVGWDNFKKDLARWHVMHHTAGKPFADE